MSSNPAHVGCRCSWPSAHPVCVGKAGVKMGCRRPPRPVQHATRAACHAAKGPVPVFHPSPTLPAARSAPPPTSAPSSAVHPTLLPLLATAPGKRSVGCPRGDHHCSSTRPNLGGTGLVASLHSESAASSRQATPPPT